MNGFDHLSQTFEAAEKAHPDLMEPYTVLLSQATENAAERMEIMRRGLRETIRRRYPLHDAVVPAAPTVPA